MVDGARLTVIGSDKTTLLELPFKTGGPAAVIALARLMGEEPQVVDVPATQCNSHETTAKWGAAFWVTYVIDSVDPNELNRFSISSQKAATGGGVNIETQSGFSVGDPIHDLIAGTPNVEVQDSAGDGTTAWIGMDANQTGTMAASDPGTGLVRLIAAPASRNADC